MNKKLSPSKAKRRAPSLKRRGKPLTYWVSFTFDIHSMGELKPIVDMANIDAVSDFRMTLIPEEFNQPT